MAVLTAEPGTELRFRLQENSRQFNIEIHKEKEMLALRKLFLVLAVVALFAAIPASADTAFSCAGTAGAPPLIRAEGLAEYVGDLLLSCTGGIAGTPLQANVRALIGQTTITSNILASGGTQTEAVLAIDDPKDPALGAAAFGAGTNPPQCAQATCSGGVYATWAAANGGGTTVPQNLFLGSKAANNQVEWLGVSIMPPGSTGTRTIRVTNIRVDATAVASSTYVAGTVSEYISITGTTSVPVSPQPQTVAFVTPSINVTVGNVQSYKQCAAPTAYPTITFTELFASAFRKKIETSYTALNGVANVEQSTLGGTYFTESGFTNTALLGSAGVATQGTQFVVRIKNINSGVTVTFPSSVTSTVSGLKAKAVSTTLAITGSGSVVYEVTGDASEAGVAGPNGYNVTDSFVINPTVSYTVGIATVSTTPVTINGNYYPISTVNLMSYADPEPRFKDSVTADSTFFSLSVSCRTLLLFPFLTNQATFDTGVAIMNTSSDPFSTINQAGTCSLNYYGNSGPSAAVTTPTVNAGEMLAFTLSGGGNVIGRSTATVSGAPGFQGYMFAICNFQYAHGYAFVTKQGATDIAHGYIALVVPDRTAGRIPQNAATRAGSTSYANQGEQLAF
jgi:hypothetical protein